MLYAISSLNNVLYYVYEGSCVVVLTQAERKLSRHRKLGLYFRWLKQPGLCSAIHLSIILSIQPVHPSIYLFNFFTNHSLTFIRLFLIMFIFNVKFMQHYCHNFVSSKLFQFWFTHNKTFKFIFLFFSIALQKEEIGLKHLGFQYYVQFTLV